MSTTGGKAHISTSPFIYFSVKNLAEAERDFFEHPDKNPHFIYGPHFDEKFINEQLIKYQGFPVKRRRLNYVLVAKKLQNNRRYLKDFQAKTAEIYGLPNLDYFDRALYFITSRYGTKTITDPALKAHISKLKKRELVNKQTFEMMRSYFKRYFSESEPSKNLDEAIKKFFNLSNLQQNGWTLIALNNTSHAKCIQSAKQIQYGTKYKATRKDAYAYDSIAIHEIFGHAVRETGRKPRLDDSEGWATLLEQIAERSFRTKRIYRYLAASFALGLHDGKPHDFRETYNLLYQIISLSGRYDERHARKSAFKETVRVFRGGRPDIPGAIFTKDIAYLKGNLQIWDKLEAEPISYEDFVNLLEGKEWLSI